MARTNVDIDEKACATVMRPYGLVTKRDAVNLALGQSACRLRAQRQACQLDRVAVGQQLPERDARLLQRGEVAAEPPVERIPLFPEIGVSSQGGTVDQRGHGSPSDTSGGVHRADVLAVVALRGD
jgi:Arc/MetJ family transcription regulator